MDLEDDVTAEFDLIHTMDMDDHGVGWIADEIMRRVGKNPVVISLDVDVMDPSYVPASTSKPVSYPYQISRVPEEAELCSGHSGVRGMDVERA